jgi:hypothetical protein
MTDKKFSPLFFLPALLFLVLIFSPTSSSAGTAAVYGAYSGNKITDHILGRTEYEINELFSISGLYYPADYHRKKISLEKAPGRGSENFYSNAARIINADIAVFCGLTSERGIFRLSLKAVLFTREGEKLLLDTTVRSSIPENIPLKAALKCAEFLKEMKLESEVTGLNEDGRAVIDAGQWNGLEKGKYKTGSGDIYVEPFGRYVSYVTGEELSPGDIIIFDIYPHLTDYIKEREKAVIRNIVKKHGTDDKLNKRDGSSKELVYGTCIINPGASILLPGYGSFLSLEYMGIDNGEPDWTGITASAALVAAHLTLPGIMTDFDVNFFPWVKDSDKTDEMQRFQIFLWASIPLTYTMSFYNQMAYQYHRKNILPPMLNEIDNTSTVISLFVPGGGLFYKGYRGAGYGFYAAEMSLFGYGIYTGKSSRRKAAFAGFAAVKAADIALAWFLEPAYSVYRNEMSSIESGPRFSLGIVPGAEGSGDFVFAVTQSF